MEAIFTENAPKPIGPYSQAILVDGLLFVSGQIPIDPSTGKMVEGGFKEKALRALLNVKAIVEAAGGSVRDIVKVTVYMKDLSRFSEFNEVYEKVMEGHKPARAVIGVAVLPAGAEIEIEAIAVIKGGRS